MNSRPSPTHRTDSHSSQPGGSHVALPAQRHRQPTTLSFSARHTPNTQHPSLTVLYHNCAGLYDNVALPLTHQIRSTDPHDPSAPLVYALVEAGPHNKHIEQCHDWVYHHMPGNETQNARSGGIAIVTHATCPASHFTPHKITCATSAIDMRSSAIATALITPSGRETFLLIVVYVNPKVSCHRRAMDAVCASIETAMARHRRYPALIVGDFNARHERWHDDRGSDANTNKNNPGDTALAEAIDDIGLEVHNPPNMPTHIVHRTDAPPSLSTIDLVLSQPPCLVTAVRQRYAPSLQRNDHLPFDITLSLRRRQAPPAPPRTHPRYKWATADEPATWQRALPVAMITHLTPIQPLLAELDAPHNGGNIDNDDSTLAKLEAVYAPLEAAILAACSDVVRRKTVRRRRAQEVPWWTAEVERAHTAVRNRNRARGAALRRKDWTAVQCADNEVREAWKQWRATAKQARRQASNELATLVMDPDSKIRYATLRRYQRSTIAPLDGIHDKHNTPPASLTQSLDNLCNAFIESSTPPDTTLPPPVQRACKRHDSDSWVFTADDVAAQTQRRTCKTAAGPDAILPLFLRYGGQALWHALATVYNYSWRHSVTPQAWRDANVAALYKGKGSRDQPTSYRPISVTSGIARTFEHLIHDKLAPLVGPTLADVQFGFRPRRSTTDAILHLLTPLQYICGRQTTTAAGQPPQGSHQKRCAALFLDIKKAFDRVDHGILLQRLHLHNVDGTAWRWIKHFLTGRRMRCVSNQSESHWQHIPHGVPQGCVLSPLLFLVFIDNAITAIHNDRNCSLISPTFYADDGVLGPKLSTCREAINSAKTNPTFESRYGKHLAAAAAHLNDWCTESRMQFGADKTKVVVFNRSTVASNKPFDNINLCGYTVDVADEYDYLGLTVTNRLQWGRHAARKIRQARDVSARLTYIARHAQPVQPAVIRELVLSCLVPSFDYGIEFWGIGITDTVTRQLQAAMATPLRAALGLPRTAHQVSVLYGAGIAPVATHIQHKQLMHLQRVAELRHDTSSGNTNNTTHPTALLYDSIHRHSREPYGVARLLGATVTTPIPAYLTCTIPPNTMCDNTPAALTRPTAGTARLNAARRTDVSPRRRPKAAGTATKRAWQALDAMGAAAAATEEEIAQRTHRTAGARRQRDKIRSIRDRAAHLEWCDSHAQPQQPPQVADALDADNEAPAQPAPATRTPHTRATTAPIVLCLDEPDDRNNRNNRPPLRFLHTRYAPYSRRADLVRRARLVYGRSYTATVRRRFASRTDTAAHTASTHCSHTSCAAAGTDETIEHVLLHCPRHATARAALVTAMAHHDLQLTLKTLLNPPALATQQHTIRLYIDTDRFLRAVARTRRDEQLPHLDSDTATDSDIPPSPPPTPPPHDSPPDTPPDTPPSKRPRTEIPPLSLPPPAALAAPPHRDTG